MINSNVIFKRFVTGKGVENVRLEGNTVEIFDSRYGLNHVDACKEYSKADLFVVTHPESMGLSVIESAMAGCLVLSPKGYIKSSLIKPLHHIEFESVENIPWQKAIDGINHKLARSKASKFNWSNLSNKIINDLLN